MSTLRTGPRPADFADVRAQNLAVVLRHVRVAAPCSRAQIAASTGLNKATVSSLVAELIDRRVLRETGLTENRIGRPATMLVLDGSGYVGIGIELGTDHLTAIAVDLAGRRVLTWRQSWSAAHRGAGRRMAELIGLARRAAARVRGTGGTVVGLNVAVPGLVDSAGVVRRADALGWTDVELRRSLERALADPAHPIGVHDNATLGALAEYRYGVHAGTAHLLYLAGPPGGAVGIINAGVPLRGAHGYGGVFGHAGVPLPHTGADSGARFPVDLDVELLARRAGAGDEPPLAALDEVGSRLGPGLAVLVNLLDPAAVLLGGHYAPLARWLVPPIERELRPHTVAPDAGALRIAASTHGYEAPALGGAVLALDAMDSAGVATH